MYLLSWNLIEILKAIISISRFFIQRKYLSNEIPKCARHKICLNMSQLPLLVVCLWLAREIEFGLERETGLRLSLKVVFPGMGISIIKIRRSRDRLIFIMGIPTLVRRCLYIETVPWYPMCGLLSMVFFISCLYVSCFVQNLTQDSWALFYPTHSLTNSFPKCPDMDFKLIFLIINGRFSCTFVIERLIYHCLINGKSVLVQAMDRSRMGLC